MGKANALSRMTNLKAGVNDNKNITLLKPNLFINSLTQHPEDKILNKIRKYVNNINKSAVDALAAKDKDWVNEVGNIITWKNWIYVPKNQMLQGEIITKHHDTVLG